MTRLHSLFLPGLLAAGSILAGQAPPAPGPARVAATAKGSFEVSVTPLAEGSRQGVWRPGRMALSKRFQGDLDGTSQGEMMSVLSPEGSGGYAALERVEGALQGRKGTFLLLHHGLMTRGVPGEWGVVVVPDSGTDGLKGLEGRMTITITGKEHAYTLEYSLPDIP
jgi:hypothetical protein